MRQMINVGKQIRYNRIVNPDTGRTLIVPLDHDIIISRIGPEYLAEPKSHRCGFGAG